MLDTRRRRPVELASSVSSDGPFSENPSEPQLIPGSLATCPAECTPRPRNLTDYRAACAAAAGEPVKEINACDAMPGMRVWHSTHFLTVSSALRDGSVVELLLVGTGYVASRYTLLETPLYRLA